MATEAKDPHLRLHVYPDPPDPIPAHVPFFGRRRRQRRGTWAVSVSVIVLLVVFVVTMLVNDCPRVSGTCVFSGVLGRFAFQPIFENPLLGPASSTLLKMGALQRTMIIQHKERWRVFSFPWLHAGIIHLLVNISSTIFIGVHLEQEFGPLRTAIIYLLSGFTGAMTSVIFVQHVPLVGASSALFGLLGAALSGLVRNWNKYSEKTYALELLGFIALTNFALGALPRVDNFANIGGLVSGILLGYAILFDPQLSELERSKGIFDYDLSVSVKLKQKLDRPVPRIIAVTLFLAMLAGVFVADFRGVQVQCTWCRYADCMPTRLWSCNQKASRCQTAVSDGRLTLTCSVGDKFATYPFANVSRTRMDDLCSLVCS